MDRRTMLGALKRERSQGGAQRPQDPLETENTKKRITITSQPQVNVGMQIHRLYTDGKVK